MTIFLTCLAATLAVGAVFAVLLAIAACMNSSDISREEERGYLFEEEQSGASEGAWPLR